MKLPSNLKNFLLKIKQQTRFFFVFLLCCPVGLSAAQKKSDQTSVFRGPLKILADQTQVLEHGKKVYASGNVKANYEMENKDVVETYSDQAIYLEETQTGTLKGHPRAFWKQGIGRYSTRLKADIIELRMKNMELWASGHVRIDQSSNTMLAGQIIFSHPQKKFYTLGPERVRFDVQEKEYRTTIFSDKVVAWTDQQQIYFLGRVQGKIYLKQESK